ncbi:hypothetical protein [Corallococcus llansteffanensis]|uniref:Uncharacterized protein n=1 Tax=Corallococcus llansteffanensis TaxID=2316731 RepID=A0A3A8NW21_9BACT|nr:hypothetical protein [Corallococcus llansteffanensis]RKH47360.1 hypothetical protein D7V93_34065 [Corallococcus llansteffanensis]
MSTMNLKCAVLALVLGGTAQAVEPMVPYDNFNPTEPNPARATKVRGIDPARWVDHETGTRLESARELAFTRLRLMSRSDTPGAGSFGLLFSHSSAVTAIAAKVRLNNARTTGYTAPGAPAAESTAELTGHFFNTRTGVPSKNQQDDVIAAIRIVSRSTDPVGSQLLRVEALIERCTNASCSTRAQLFAADLGQVHQGEQAALRVQWDVANHRFVFQRDAQPEVYGAYTVTDTFPPASPNKALVVTHNPPTYLSGAPAPLGYANAYFHDVFVNESAAPAP